MPVDLQSAGKNQEVNELRRKNCRIHKLISKGSRWNPSKMTERRKHERDGYKSREEPERKNNSGRYGTRGKMNRKSITKGEEKGQQKDLLV